MGFESYSTTPASNTSISGIALGENVMSPADVNNALRQLMADAATFYAAVNGGGGSSQPLNAILTAWAALTWAADTLGYATGTSSFATTTLTAFGRSLIAAPDAASAASLIGSGGAGAVSGNGSSGSQALGSLTLTWKRVTLTGNLGTGTSTQAFGNSHTYASWANAWLEGDDGDADVGYYIDNSATTTSNATIHYKQSSTTTLTLFSIGV